jgi:hypothetical protein
MEEIETLIQHASGADYNSANKTFAQIMADKMEASLEQERIKVSAEIYNDVDPDQLELDLDGDEDEDEVIDADVVEAEDEIEDETPEDDDV